MSFANIYTNNLEVLRKNMLNHKEGLENLVAKFLSTKVPEALNNYDYDRRADTLTIPFEELNEGNIHMANIILSKEKLEGYYFKVLCGYVCLELNMDTLIGEVGNIWEE